MGLSSFEDLMTVGESVPRGMINAMNSPGGGDPLPFAAVPGHSSAVEPHQGLLPNAVGVQVGGAFPHHSGKPSETQVSRHWSPSRRSHRGVQGPNQTPTSDRLLLISLPFRFTGPDPGLRRIRIASELIPAQLGPRLGDR